jgi:hypothetical protein
MLFAATEATDILSPTALGVSLTAIVIISKLFVSYIRWREELHEKQLAAKEERIAELEAKTDKRLHVLAHILKSTGGRHQGDS